MAQFHVHVVMQLLKIKLKACNESKGINMNGYFAITKLANLSQKVKCSGMHVVCNYWWYIHSLLWFM